MAIGPQNAFVLRQGLQRQHALLAALACSVADSLLISIGVLGVGRLLASNPLFIAIGTLAGATFLIWYGWRSFMAARQPNVLEISGTATSTPNKIISTALAFSLLNPHALLDTVMLIGGASAGLDSAARTTFLMGTIVASWLWFFGLALAGNKLAPVMTNPRAWQILDILIGVMMWSIATGLLWNLWQGGH